MQFESRRGSGRIGVKFSDLLFPPFGISGTHRDLAFPNGGKSKSSNQTLVRAPPNHHFRADVVQISVGRPEGVLVSSLKYRHESTVVISRIISVFVIGTKVFQKLLLFLMVENV